MGQIITKYCRVYMTITLYRISGSMSATFIEIRSRMAGLERLKIGSIRVFIVMRNKACILKLGVLTAIYRG